MYRNSYIEAKPEMSVSPSLMRKNVIINPNGRCFFFLSEEIYSQFV